MVPDQSLRDRLSVALCEVTSSADGARLDAMSFVDSARFWSSSSWRQMARNVPSHRRALYCQGVLIAEEELGWLPGSRSAGVVVRSVLGDEVEVDGRCWSHSLNPYVLGATEPWLSYSQAVVEVAEDGQRFVYPGGRRRSTAWVVTASNPGARLLTVAENEERHNRLVLMATGAGAFCMSAIGRDQTGEWTEQSVALRGASRALAVALGNEFGQDAVFEIDREGNPEVVPCRPLLAPANSPLSFLLAHAATAPWCTQMGCTTCGAADFRWGVRALAEGLSIKQVLLRDHQYSSLRARGGIVPRSRLSDEGRQRLLSYIAATTESAWSWPGLKSPHALALSNS